MARRPRSLAAPLTWAWSALVIYASLFPFEEWRWPAGASAGRLLLLPWPRYFIPFDIVSNLLGYAPLGFLLALTRLRHGAALVAALAGALVLATGLSFGMEVVQNLLPYRVPSSLDWLLNSAGAGLGALLAWACQASGALARWDAMRERWLERGNGGALALLLLWPAALLFPLPVPLGVGQVWPELRRWLSTWVDDVAWAEPLAARVGDWLAAVPVAETPLPPLADGLAVMLGLLAPCLLAFTASRPGPRRIWLVLGAAVFGAAMTTLSSALSFGPEHALTWQTPGHGAALVVAVALAASLLWANPRLAGGLALVSLTGLVVLVHLAPADPYFAQNLQAWEQGRFIRFNGLAQWVGWAWPYAALAVVLGRVARP